jgi:hypothetical protein
VRPKLVAEVTYVIWAADGPVRNVDYEGLREDKAARNVRRVGFYLYRGLETVAFEGCVVAAI